VCALPLGRSGHPPIRGALDEECSLDPSRAPDLAPPSPVLAPFCDAVARGAARGLASVRGPAAPPWAVVSERAAVGSLATFPAQAVPCSDDMMVSLVARVGPGPAATTVLALEPEAALVWVRDRLGPGPWPAEEALAAVREVGASVLAGVFETLLEAPVGGPVALEEDALTATLIRTHAPPEATLVSAELVVAGEHAHLRAVLLVLAEPKGVAALLPAAVPREAGPASEGAVVPARR